MERAEQEGGQPRVPTDRVELGRRQSARARQRRHVDGDLAEVVELRGGDETLALPLGQLDELEEPLDVGGDALRVLARRGIASVDDVGQRLERLCGLLLELL